MKHTIKCPECQKDTDLAVKLDFNDFHYGPEIQTQVTHECDNCQCEFTVFVNADIDIWNGEPVITKNKTSEFGEVSNDPNQLKLL